ncbi:MAG: hypothetical protein KJ574_04300 [Nanoarchaeota archaeon]|nr:hypothetical protein [Nanoarchaeota archaeon]
MRKIISVHDKTFEVDFVIPPAVEEFLKDHQMTDEFIQTQAWDIYLHDALLDEKFAHLADHEKLVVVVNGFFISDTDHIYINPRDVIEEKPLISLSNRSNPARGNPPYSIYYVVYEKKRARPIS